MVLRPSSCETPNCPGKATLDKTDFLYVELFHRNEEYRTQGHPDGYLQIPGLPGLGILEVKSISSRSSYEVKHIPSMNHVVQLQTYFWLTGLQWGKILYWDKGAPGMSALMEHHVVRDEEIIANLQGMVRSIRVGMQQGGPLPARLCATATCPRAKSCGVVAKCFEE
jgi:hypothetical protein